MNSYPELWIISIICITVVLIVTVLCSAMNTHHYISMGYHQEQQCVSMESKWVK